MKPLKHLLTTVCFAVSISAAHAQSATDGYMVEQSFYGTPKNDLISSLVGSHAICSCSPKGGNDIFIGNQYTVMFGGRGSDHYIMFETAEPYPVIYDPVTGQQLVVRGGVNAGAGLGKIYELTLIDNGQQLHFQLANFRPYLDKLWLQIRDINGNVTMTDAQVKAMLDVNGNGYIGADDAQIYETAVGTHNRNDGIELCLLPNKCIGVNGQPHIPISHARPHG